MMTKNTVLAFVAISCLVGGQAWAGLIERVESTTESGCDGSETQVYSALAELGLEQAEFDPAAGRLTIHPPADYDFDLGSLRNAVGRVGYSLDKVVLTLRGQLVEGPAGPELRIKVPGEAFPVIRTERSERVVRRTRGKEVRVQALVVEEKDGSVRLALLK